MMKKNLTLVLLSGDYNFQTKTNSNGSFYFLTKDNEEDYKYVAPFIQNNNL